MLTPEDVEALLAWDPIRRRERRVIWITGRSGAGKTWLLAHLSARLAREHEVETFSDRDELNRLVEEDREQRHHRKAAGSFVITGSEIDRLVIERAAALARAERAGYLLIELARGHDVEGVRDLSFRAMARAWDETIEQRSVILYLRGATSTRLRRDADRLLRGRDGTHGGIGQDLMERFYASDDFDAWSRNAPCPVRVLDNG